MNIYLAGAYKRRLEIRDYAEQVESMGHTVMSRWLYGGSMELDKGEDSVSYSMDVQQFALNDIEDIENSDILISFTEPRFSVSTGGRHVEFGMAVRMKKKLIAVGPRENIFYTLPEVIHFDTWDDTVDYLSVRYSECPCGRDKFYEEC